MCEWFVMSKLFDYNKIGEDILFKMLRVVADSKFSVSPRVLSKLVNRVAGTVSVRTLKEMKIGDWLPFETSVALFVTAARNEKRKHKFGQRNNRQSVSEKCATCSKDIYRNGDNTCLRCMLTFCDVCSKLVLCDCGEGSAFDDAHITVQPSLVVDYSQM